jgi:tetratricopeptide (TPR) repeat protein
MIGKAGEVIKLQRTSAYWAGRALRHRREGDRRRAAALLRHAVALSPADGGLRMAYARALREMECYEASNRAAFGALVLEPRRYAAYGVIGSNMLALGHQQEAMDAFSRYLLAVRRAGGEPEFDAELDELERTETTQPHLHTRHETQLDIAGRRLGRGDLPAAQRALARAAPARGLSDRYDSLRALLLDAQGDQRGALRSAERACRLNPASCRARCMLAGVYANAGKRVKAASALLRAALSCATAQDEQLLCYTAVGLHFPEIALCALRRATRQSPDRLPALFDMGITMLRLGRMDAAGPLLNRCRDLDPDDVPARFTLRTIDKWAELLLTPAQVRWAARALPFYPHLSPAGHSDCLSQLAQALSDGVERFCERLTEDPALYGLLLYELGGPEPGLARLLPVIAARLPRAFAERLLREVLVLHTPDDHVKRHAAAGLLAIGAKAPYVVWHAGRIAEIDPSVQSRRGGSFSRVMLVRRMADIHRKAQDPRLMTHALRLIHRMGTHHRASVVRDQNRVFRAALEQHYLLTYGLPDNRRLGDLLRYTADERRRVRVAFHLFCKLLPIPAPVPRA